MKKIIIIAAIALLAASCAKHPSENTASADTDTTATAGIAEADSIDAQFYSNAEEEDQQVLAAEVTLRAHYILDQMEKAYSKNAEMSGRDIERLYTSASWKRLLQQVDSVDRLTPEYIGFFDHDYFCQCQDYENIYFTSRSEATLEIRPNEPMRAYVNYEIVNFEQYTPMTMVLVNEDGEWNIDNFFVSEVDNDGNVVQTNMRTLMEEYVQNAGD